MIWAEVGKVVIGVVLMAISAGVTIVLMAGMDATSGQVERKAVTLLRLWLSPEQAEQYSSYGHFEVIGSDTGTRYRIRHGLMMNIDQLDSAGNKVCEGASRQRKPSCRRLHVGPEDRAGKVRERGISNRKPSTKPSLRRICRVPRRPPLSGAAGALDRRRGQDHGRFTLILANAAHIRNAPGRKRDVNDATWIAELLAHGLIRARFVPPQPIQELRDPTRTRKELTREIIRHKRRIIHLFLDHARCHRVKLVRQWLARPGCRISSPTRRSASCANKPLASERTSAIWSLITFATRNSRRDPVGRACLCFGWLEPSGCDPLCDNVILRRLRPVDDPTAARIQHDRQTKKARAECR